jgi:pilus assembly protein CpaC
MMKAIHRHWIIGLLGLVTISLETVAQTPEAPVAEKPVVAEEPKTAEATPVADVPVKTGPKRLIKKPSEHRISRYNTERSEKESDQVNVWLGVGVDKVFDIDSELQIGDRQESILESNTNVVKVAQVKIGERKQLIFKGLAEGIANVMIRDKSGEIRIIYNVIVAKQDLERMARELKDNIREIEGVTVKLEGQKIVVEGEVVTPNDYGMLVNVINDRIYSDVVSNRVVMSPVTLNALAKKIESDIQVFAPTVRASVLNGKIILDGTVDSEGVKQRAMKRAELYLPTIKLSDPMNKDPNNIEKNEKPLQIVQSDIQVSPPQPKRESKLLRLNVYFVELSKDFLKTFGFKWQPGFTADPSITLGTTATGSVGTSDGGGFTFSGTLSSLFPALNSTPASSAYGRILKSATIVAKSGEKARISDKQEIPTQTIGQNGMMGNGTPVNVGFDVEITPTILQGQDVDMSIDLDQVNVVGKGLGGVPITAKHHVGSRLYLKSGEVGAVAGINNSDISTTFNRDDPSTTSFGGNTRPLFTLQRSKGMSKKRGQFVVFVSPQIIENASDGTEDLKKNFRMKSN